MNCQINNSNSFIISSCSSWPYNFHSIFLTQIWLPFFLYSSNLKWLGLITVHSPANGPCWCPLLENPWSSLAKIIFFSLLGFFTREGPSINSWIASWDKWLTKDRWKEAGLILNSPLTRQTTPPTLGLAGRLRWVLARPKQHSSRRNASGLLEKKDRIRVEMVALFLASSS